MQQKEQASASQKLQYQLENVEGLFPFKKVKPSQTVKRKITDVHGTLKGTEVRKLVEQKEEEDRQQEERKKERIKKKEESKVMFIKCQEKCVCSTSVCKAVQLQQCSVCKSVLKSKCGKKACKIDGEAPVMILVAARKNRTAKRKRKSSDEESEEELEEDELEQEQQDQDEDKLDVEEEEDIWDTEDDESFHGFEDEDEDDLDGYTSDKENEIDLLMECVETQIEREVEKDEEFTAIKRNPRGKKCTDMDKIRELQENLDDNQNGQFFCVYYEEAYYWGKSLHMFSEDPESNVETVELVFMHKKLDGFWDWPKENDQKQVSSKFIFLGPCMPDAPTKKGFRFPEEEKAKKLYRLMKNNLGL